MKKIMTLLALAATVNQAGAQDKYFTKTGKINFDATAKNSPENIDGLHKSVTCVLDTRTGNLQFAVLMKGFEFERALMQEHFNENYVESDKFPKAEFKGQVGGSSAEKFSKDGSYDVTVKGKLTIHGITRDVETPGKLVVSNGNINAIADFQVSLADYKIEIPQLVADKVAKTASIKVDCRLAPLKQ
ncbi:YceI family protein [Flavihumibacter stibioxidans]|uniref:Polyisoprenoid-binding protein n=1 Tax=Flavihumibacter stibioxidans TaxID=1834163 RepID=A0ABR7MBB8_9BACT|nr:YceI family protein [Flavihumibacter stibioxidans]MBC6492134.1 polyisoprenoid-binding protein [Flavihumibacter stibioxidans]